MLSTLRHAIRSLLRSPSFTVTVIATLAIGIGLNAAIFAVVDCVLLRPLGYHNADRIVALETHFVDENRSIPRLGGDDYVDAAKQVKGLEAAAYYQSYSDGILLNGNAIYLPVANVSPRFMDVMGIQPIAGRLFHGDDVRSYDAIVGESFATEHFGSAAGAIGQTIQYGGPHAIVGVLPEAFSFPGRTHLWMEESAAPANLNRTSYSERVIAKRRAEVTPEQLKAEMAAFSSQLQRAYVEDAHKTIEAVPLQDQIVGRVQSTLKLLMGAVGVIVLILCVNIAHLQLVRATRQLRSVAIRNALGASRGRLAARSIVEVVLLAVAGSLAAVFLAVPALRLLVRIAPQGLPRVAEVHLNADVFFFSFVVALIVMAATALLPLWRAWHVDPATALRSDSSRGTEPRGAMRVRDGLIVAEVALTLTLSVAAILLARQLIAQSRVDLGFAAESLVTLDVSDVGATPLPDYPQNQSTAGMAAYEVAALPVKLERLTRLDATLASLRGMPGVIASEAILGAPMMLSGSDVNYAVKGRHVFGGANENLPNANLAPVTAGLFSAMGMPLLRGRAFNGNDRMGTPPVVVIDAELARTVFANQDPLGKQIMCGYDDVQGWWTIVGVVGAIRGQSPGEAPRPTLYVPVAQHPSGASGFQIVVRAGLAPAVMAEALRKHLTEARPEIAVKATTMRENIGETQRLDTFRSLLFGSFAGVSLLLAAVGMYGVTAYSVAQRKFEFGLRVALGANRPQLFGMVLRKAMAFAIAGVVIGIGLSFGLVRVLASVVGKLPANDPVAYALASLTVLGIAVSAMFLPARTAANIDPMTVLRSE